VYSWGIASFGCLGHGDEKHLAVPKLIEGILKEKIVVGAAAGAYHSILLLKEGDVIVFGKNDVGQIGLPAKEVRNYGDGKGGKEMMWKRLDMKTPISLKLPLRCVQVAASNYHSLLLLEDHAVCSLGSDPEVCGRDIHVDDIKLHPNDSLEHFIVTIPDKVTYVSCGYNHSAVITAGSDLYTWGKNEAGQW
jgi:alpha-tubulin suppressor-like RCC1 family protein